LGISAVVALAVVINMILLIFLAVETDGMTYTIDSYEYRISYTKIRLKHIFWSVSPCRQALVEQNIDRNIALSLSEASLANLCVLGKLQGFRN